MMKNIIFQIKVQTRLIYLMVTICLLITFSGCKKWIEVNPPINEVVGKEIYNSNITAASVLTGIYTDMSQGIFTGIGSISLKTGLSADELVSTTETSNILHVLYTNTLTNNGDQLFWTELYSYIFRINSAIEGISASDGITEPVKKQLLGEAKFLRALMYFYLVNSYGDVPLLISTDIKINSTASRTAVESVYSQVISDLTDSQVLLSKSYLGGNAQTASEDRLRPNFYVATALLSRVYLYTRNWQGAEAEADKLISEPVLSKLEDLQTAFLSISKETIWALQPINSGQNTLDAEVFVLAAGLTSNPNPGPNGDNRPVYLSKQLFNSFEEGDLRKGQWIDSVEVDGIVYPFAYKYKKWEIGEPRSEYLVMFRLSEQYLIRAEARAKQGKLAGSNSALEDLNEVRKRANLEDFIQSGESQIMDAILQERRHELFTEMGHRWFDLKRSNTITNVMNQTAPSKGTSWQPYQELYPIPTFDIQHNSSLKGNQNPGYPEN